MGSNHNEAFHRNLNRKFSGRNNMTPEVAELLTLALSSDKNNRIDKAFFTVCLFLPQEVNCEEDHVTSYEETLSDSEEQSCDTDKLKPTKEESEVIMQNVEALSEVIGQLPKHLLLNPMLLLSSQFTHPTHGQSNSDFLNETLTAFEKVLVPIKKDGDCLFSAVSHQLQQCSGQLEDQFLSYLKDVHISLSKELPELAHQLRQATINHIVANRALYMDVILEEDIPRFDEIATNYRQRGQFAGEFGDILSQALVNLLGIVLIVLNTAPPERFTTVKSSTLKTSTPFVVVYHGDGPGHYDSTTSQSKGSEQLEDNQSTARRCYCGVKGKAVANCREKCGCSRNSQGCNSSCKCKGCQNPFGAKLIRAGKQDFCRCGVFNKKKYKASQSEMLPLMCSKKTCTCLALEKTCNQQCRCIDCSNPCGPKDSKVIKRSSKRRAELKNMRMSSQQATGRDFLQKQGADIQEGWSFKQTLLLHVLATSQKKCPSIPKLTKAFNQIADMSDGIGTTKTQQQVSAKMAKLKRLLDRPQKKQQK